jgi:hypothetical protein
MSLLPLKITMKIPYHPKINDEVIQYCHHLFLILAGQLRVMYICTYSAMLVLKGAHQGFFLSISSYVSLKGCVEYIG